MQSDQLEEFLKSSEKTRNSWKKLYIVTLIPNNKLMAEYKEDPPFRLKIPCYENIYVLRYNYTIPGLIKDISVLDTNDGKIYSHGNSYNIENYRRDLYRLQRLVSMLRTNVEYLQFFMMKRVYFLMDKLNMLLSEYEESIQIINEPELITILQQLKDSMASLENIFSNRSSFIDSQTSRLLTILTIITFPMILMAGWFGMNFGKKQMRFLNENKGYIIVVCVSVIYLLICIYIFKNDILYSLL